MSLFVTGNAGSKFYVDMEHGDVFEEGADGVFVLKRINGKKERIAIDAIPDECKTGQQLFYTEKDFRGLVPARRRFARGRRQNGDCGVSKNVK